MEQLIFTDGVRQAVCEVLTDLLSTDGGQVETERAERYTDLVELTLNETLRHAYISSEQELIVVEGMVKTIFEGTTAARRNILQKWQWAYKRAEKSLVEKIQAGFLSGSPGASAWCTEGGLLLTVGGLNLHSAGGFCTIGSSMVRWSKSIWKLEVQKKQRNGSVFRLMLHG